MRFIRYNTAQFFSQIPWVSRGRWKKGATVIKRASRNKPSRIFGECDSNGTVLLEGQLQIMVGKMHNGLSCQKINLPFNRTPNYSTLTNAPREKNRTRNVWRATPVAVEDYGSRESGVGVCKNGDSRNWRYHKTTCRLLSRWRGIRSSFSALSSCKNMYRLMPSARNSINWAFGMGENETQVTAR